MPWMYNAGLQKPTFALQCTFTLESHCCHSQLVPFFTQLHNHCKIAGNSSNAVCLSVNKNPFPRLTLQAARSCSDSKTMCGCIYVLGCRK